MNCLSLSITVVAAAAARGEDSYVDHVCGYSAEWAEHAI